MAMPNPLKRHFGLSGVMGVDARKHPIMSVPPDTLHMGTMLSPQTLNTYSHDSLSHGSPVEPKALRFLNGLLIPLNFIVLAKVGEIPRMVIACSSTRSQTLSFFG